MKDLARQLNRISESQAFDVSWSVKLISAGKELDRGGDTVLPAASVRKISVMMAALSAVHEGRLDLAAPVTIDQHLQKDIVSGVCQYMTPGLVIPMRDAILLMIITSDNICTYEVMKTLDLAELTEYCRQVGMIDTVHRTLLPPVGLPRDHSLEVVTTTTVRDQLLLLDLIQLGTKKESAARQLRVTPVLCRLALQFLCWQRFRNMIPALLPLNTVVANKTGRGQRGWMDAGIVFGNATPLYILSAATDNVPETLADGLPGHVTATRAIAQISRACWDFL